MNTSIVVYTKEQLSTMKMVEITAHYNVVAKEIGLKAVKKFRDKDTSISRVLEAQETYQEDLELVSEPEVEVKPEEVSEQKITGKQNKYGVYSDSVIKFKQDKTYKEGTIEKALVDAIKRGASTVEEIVKSVMDNYTCPRSSQGINEEYVIHNIKWFIKKGTLEVI